MDILELTGCTKEEILEKIVDRGVERLITEPTWDEDGNETTRHSDVYRKIQGKIQTYLDAAITRMGDEHVLPHVDDLVAGFVLQQTNSWGEKKKEPVTLVEYVVQRAHAYMLEEVNYDGKSKEEAGGYQWTKAGTRLALAVDKHIQYHINTAMKAILADANATLTAGIVGTVKAQLEEVQSRIKVGVTTGR